MKKFELKVYYDSNTIYTKLDNEIEGTLKRFGYRRWTSGMNMIDGIRDLRLTK